MQITTRHETCNQTMWYDKRIVPEIEPRFFDPEWHRREGGYLGSATGRGSAHFVRHDGHDLVIRPARRGGLIGRINSELYLRGGAERSRTYREYKLLEWMSAQNLPVPKPVAARYAPCGPWYRADLITQLIPNARTLADILHDRALPAQVWSDIGAVIRRMHALGVDHTDLNCRNILLDADMQVWLIDFDKCRRRPDGRWQCRNIARLKRSFEKEAIQHPQVQWSKADWADLLAGYES